MAIEQANGSTTGTDLVPVAGNEAIDASPVDTIEAQDAPTIPGPSRKAVERELAEIADHRRKDRRSYFKNEAMLARELKLITMRENLKAEPPAKEPDEQAEAGELDAAVAALVPEWEEQGGRAYHEQTLQRAVEAITGNLEQEERASFEANFDALPLGARTAVFRYLSIGSGVWPAAKDAAMEEFKSIPEQRELCAEWGSRAARKVGNIRGTLKLIMGSMSEADRKAADAFIESWSPTQAKAILRVLAG
jgi:hypothetical protein